jgi:hypothetical protein
MNADVRRLFTEDHKGHKGKPLVVSSPLYLRKSAFICGSGFNFASIRVHSRLLFVLLAIFLDRLSLGDVCCGYSQAFLALYETIFD